MEVAVEKLCGELARWRDNEIRKGNMFKARLIQKVISKKKNRKTRLSNKIKQF